MKFKFKLLYIPFILGLLSFIMMFLPYLNVGDVTVTGLDLAIGKSIPMGLFKATLVFNFTYIAIFICVLFSSIILLMDDKISNIISSILFILAIVFTVLIPSNIKVSPMMGDVTYVKDSLDVSLSYGSILLIVFTSISLIINIYNLIKILKKY